MTNQGPKTTMNYIGLVPSPKNSESEIERASLNVVTRAQRRQKQPEPKMETSKQKSKREQKGELAPEEVKNLKGSLNYQRKV